MMFQRGHKVLDVFITALSIPAILLSGAILMGAGGKPRRSRNMMPPPPPPPPACKVALNGSIYTYVEGTHSFTAFYACQGKASPLGCALQVNMWMEWWNIFTHKWEVVDSSGRAYKINDVCGNGNSFHYDAEDFLLTLGRSYRINITFTDLWYNNNLGPYTSPVFTGN